MQAPPNYQRLATIHPFNRALIAALVLGGLAGLWRGSVLPLLALGAAELGWLLLVPRLPGFRRRCDEEQRAALAIDRRNELERIASKLSPNARSRLDGLARLRDRILDAVKTLSAAPTLAQQWSARLEALMNAALRILVWVDANRADDRDRRFLDSQVAELEGQVAGQAEGPSRAAREQRLEHLRRQQRGFAALVEQREAAVTQIETLEDLLRELLARGLGRDPAAFGAQLEQLAAQAALAGETAAALDRAAATEAELASLRAAR